MSEQPAADRPHDEADRKQDSGIELLGDGVISREKRICEIQRKRGVGVDVVPFDEIADGSDEDRLQPTAHITESKLVCRYCNVAHSVSYTFAITIPYPLTRALMPSILTPFHSPCGVDETTGTLMTPSTGTIK